MKLYLLEPEVAGGFGKNSILNYDSGIIKKVIHLHYEIEGWLGDDLLTTSPCFIVTNELAEAICKNNLNGYKFEDMEVSVSETFKELYPEKRLPEFKRLIPLGEVLANKELVEEWSGQDICLLNKVDIVVTEKALKVFQKFNLANCDITELPYNRNV